MVDKKTTEPYHINLDSVESYYAEVKLRPNLLVLALNLIVLKHKNTNFLVTQKQYSFYESLVNYHKKNKTLTKNQSDVCLKVKVHNNKNGVPLVIEQSYPILKEYLEVVNTLGDVLSTIHYQKSTNPYRTFPTKEQRSLY